jgi:hypothetical protein
VSPLLAVAPEKVADVRVYRDDRREETDDGSKREGVVFERNENVPSWRGVPSERRGIGHEEGDVADTNLAVVRSNLAVVPSILAVVRFPAGARSVIGGCAKVPIAHGIFLAAATNGKARSGVPRGAAARAPSPAPRRFVAPARTLRAHECPHPRQARTSTNHPSGRTARWLSSAAPSSTSTRARAPHGAARPQRGQAKVSPRSKNVDAPGRAAAELGEPLMSILSRRRERRPAAARPGLRGSPSNRSYS